MMGLRPRLWGTSQRVSVAYRRQRPLSRPDSFSARQDPAQVGSPAIAIEKDVDTTAALLDEPLGDGQSQTLDDTFSELVQAAQHPQRGRRDER
jgi:hypothetical protein